MTDRSKKEIGAESFETAPAPTNNRDQSPGSVNSNTPPNDEQDIHLNCLDCGHPFAITQGEREFYRAKGMPARKRCKPCLAERKATINRDPGRRSQW